MTATQQRLANILSEEPKLVPFMPDEQAAQVIEIFMTVKVEASTHADSSLDNAGSQYKIPSVEQRKKALEGLMKFCGSVEPTEDFDADKEDYLRSKYESLT